MTNFRVLLVEPNYPSKYPPLGLMKLSSYHKSLFNHVQFVKGLEESTIYNRYDYIYITSLFTYDINVVINTIKYYQSYHAEAEIIIGGVAASLLPDKIRESTGITPVVGLLTDIDSYPPDYNMSTMYKYNDHSFVFTSRGCPNNCNYCAVNMLEPNRSINSRWKEHINPNFPYIMVHDNNITATDDSHYADVMGYLAKLQRQVTFDNGFDCRLFNEIHCKYLSKLNLRTIRFAFDNSSQEEHIRRAIRLCNKYGIASSKIMVYVLYNYNDSLEDALYRASEIARLGARPYAMRYIPLNAEDKESFLSQGWDKELCHDLFEFVNVCRLTNAMSFQEWRDKWKKLRSKNNTAKGKKTFGRIYRRRY